MFLFSSYTNNIWSKLIFFACKEFHIAIRFIAEPVGTDVMAVGNKSSESVRPLISSQEINRRQDAGSERENEGLF